MPSRGVRGAATGRATVALVTCSEWPAGSPDDLLAVPFLERDGIRAVPVVWDEPSVKWEDFDMTILRSTWDYPEKVPEFREWLHRVHSRTAVWNPVQMVEWNLDKRYLLELASAGLRVVPTVLLEPHDARPLDRIMEETGWDDIVLKPAVGADGRGFLRVRPDRAAEGEEHLRRLQKLGGVLAQPYLPRTRERGERSILYFHGRYAFAAEYPSVGRGENRQPVAVEPTPDELNEASAIVHHVRPIPLYARLDFLPDVNGRWWLGELELAEPELLLRTCPSAPELFARAVRGELDRADVPSVRR